MLTEKALHPFSKLIRCIQLCHAALDHMVAKCTNPSDSFIICGLQIMCLMLPNNDFFFLILVTCSHSIFASFDWGVLIHLFPRHNLDLFSLISIWSFLDIKWSLHLYSESNALMQVHATMCRHSGSPAQLLTLSTQKFLLICLISYLVLFCSQTYAWWSIPLWSPWKNDSLLVQPGALWCVRRRKGSGASVREQCWLSPDVTICQLAEHIHVLSLLSFSQRQETEEPGASPLQLSFDHHSSFHLFPERVHVYLFFI